MASKNARYPPDRMPKIRRCAAVALLAALFTPFCLGQNSHAAPPIPSPGPGWTDWQGTRGSSRLRARLRDPQQNAAQHVADVEVEVENIWLSSVFAVTTVGPAQGVLRYQVDECAPVITTDTRLNFAELKSGTHTISVSVLDAKNRLLTPPAKLQVDIP